MRVAIVDDSRLFREGLAMLLMSEGIEPVALLDRAEGVVDVYGAVRPDVVILDIRMPPTYTDEGIRAASALRDSFPDCSILVLSTYAETATAVRLLSLHRPGVSGGVGYLLKDRVSDVLTLRSSLDRVAEGELLVDPGIAAQLVVARRSAPLHAMTPRERQVLRAMAEGRSNAGIADLLRLSVKAVEKYCASIFVKLGVDAEPDGNRRVLAVLAFLREER